MKISINGLHITEFDPDAFWRGLSQFERELDDLEGRSTERES